MSEHYNEAIARHYAAYRPPIHALILQQQFADSAPFSHAVDIGCGTGLSAIALTPYCDKIHGIEPSQAMIDQATSHPKVIYRQGHGESIPLESNSVDLVTFAGSLYYAKSDTLIRELCRVCHPDALILVYDFEVLLDPILDSLGLRIVRGESGYDHAINFSDCPELGERSREETTLPITMSSPQLAHVLLSSNRRFSVIAEWLNQNDPFEGLVAALNDIAQVHTIRIDTYQSLYHVNKSSATFQR